MGCWPDDRSTPIACSERGPGHPYVSFHDPLERQFAEVDPRGFLRRSEGGPVILDEIQYVLGLTLPWPLG